MIQVWGRASSSNVQALMWAIEELGLTCERHDVGFNYGGNDAAEFLAMNPNGTVPVLKDGARDAIWETGAILRFVAAEYGNDTFWPNAALARSQVDQWAEWAKLNVALMFTGPVFWRVIRTAPSKQNPKAIRRAMSALCGFLTIAEQQLAKHPYLASPEFTLADIQFGHVLFRYFDIEIDRPDLPNLRAYYERLRERPAFMTHVAVSYEELRVED